MRGCRYLIIAALAASPAGAWAAPPKTRAASDIRSELAAAKAQIAAQQQMLDAQDQRLRALEAKITGMQSPAQLATQGQAVPSGSTPAVSRPVPAIAAAPANTGGTEGVPGGAQPPLERVGQAAPGSDRPPEVAVLGTEGSVVTRKGQLTTEFGAEYARADRNQAIFRGVELIPTVLVGLYNITENNQDIMTLSGAARYGVTSKFELGVRVPFVHRANNIVSSPVNSTSQTTTSNAAQGTGLGDVELSARYQIFGARGGWPYLIGNLQVVAPTGSDPFTVPRNQLGDELKAATGSGFWGVSPSLTAILPSDPAVLFGSIGYTRNFGRSFGVRIGDAILDYVRPGDALSFSGGIGISLNQRTSINLGYAHSWAFGTKTRIRAIANDGSVGLPVESESRDLQVGRFLFGMTYRVNDRTSVNWSLEVGATRDATNMRSVLRIPLIIFAGH